MSEGPQYTSCVDKENWKSAIATVGVADITAAVGAIIAVVAGFPAVGVIVAFAAGAEIIRKVAGWLLNGKLICLKNVKRRVFNDPDPDRVCVLGRVLDFEKVGEDKTGFDTIDNDFGLNLFIAPFAISMVDGVEANQLKSQMERSPQGDLIQDPSAPPPSPGDLNPSPGPLMRKDDPSKEFGSMPSGFTGYQRGLMFSSKFPKAVPSNVYRDPHELAKVDPQLDQLGKDAYTDFRTAYSGTVFENGRELTQVEKDAILAQAAIDPLGDGRVATRFYGLVDAAFHFTEKNAQSLHCEFEGSRIRDVYNVLDFAHVHCDTSGFWGFLCDALNLLISLFLGLPKLIAAAAAWALADDGSLSSAYDGAGGEIVAGDSIVVRGRWSYDSGHSGYNEIHAVRTVQKTLPSPPDSDPYLAFQDFHNAWCSELAKVPPTPPPSRDPAAPPDTGGTPNMTPSQQATWNLQQQSENRWVYHPAIDGCVPQSPTDPNLGLH
jgi:hypothetical protein